MDDDSQVFMHGSRVRGPMSAPSTSSVSLVAYNTTFDYAINDFGGSSVAELTGSTINGVAPVSPKDGAVIHLYSWIVAQVFDGTGDHPLAGVHVEVRAFPSSMYFTGTTDVNGTVHVRALSAIVTASVRSCPATTCSMQHTGTMGTVRLVREPDRQRSLRVHSRPGKERCIRQMDLRRQADIDPPFYVSDLSPLRGSEVNLSTVINNIGVVAAYDSCQVLRRDATGQ
jgi:hypothetical protein